MGIFKLYADIARHLHRNPHLLQTAKLEELCTVYVPYAYVGNRRSLKDFLERNITYLPQERFPEALREASNREKVLWWIGGNSYFTDSGAFPDFVLAWQGTGAIGDGALLELKDSTGQGIASFNSTLPTARKRLSSLSSMVREMISRVDQGPDERDCFYLIRTMRNSPIHVRLSLVHGAFFETLPTPEVLKSLWRAVFNQAQVPPTLQEEILLYLSSLERSEIAQTRSIPKASIKPRLRIMSEIHSEGNPQLYPEILPTSFHLIVKPPEGNASIEWLVREFAKEEVKLVKAADNKVLLDGMKLECFSLYHKRNGVHVGVRYSISSSSPEGE
ncbi:MAG: hypothetical protein RML92_09390 [Bacteroidia bacterium]|nr:hypothetical protein [Bacteroidia bacterium]